MATKGYLLADTNGNIIGSTPKYGGFYAYEKAIAFNIRVTNTYQPIHLVTAGDLVAGLLSGFTFDAGRGVDANITSEADNGGLLQVVCSVNHLLTTDDLVCLTNMNVAGYNMCTKVTVNNATTFTCQNIPYVGGAGASAGDVSVPTQLIASTGSSGVYHCSISIDGTAAAANKDWKFEVKVNMTSQDNMVMERTSSATLASMTVIGNITIADGDRVFVVGKNVTDTTDYTIKNMNLNLHKII